MGLALIFTLMAWASLQTMADIDVIGSLQDILQNELADPDDTWFLHAEYDFIVVGAGTAGCVVTNRLTENPNWNVLLIEAGRSKSFYMDIPLAANYLQTGSINWDYQTVPSTNYCLGMENNQCKFPRGKVLGGSSILNYMIYTRGNRRDYDNWAELGNTGWSYDEVLPYFRKVENFRIPEYNNSEYHSQDGNVNVEYAPYRTKIADAAVQAEIEYGGSYVDYNGESQIGVSYIQASIDNGVRDSSSRAYLNSIRDRKNFHLRQNTIVTKILINNETLQAYGVEFVHLGITRTILASKEVIVSAGVINTPQLLMLSGIGPKDHLEDIGITVLKDLPVGQNFSDHIVLGGVTFLINTSDSLNTVEAFSPNSIAEYSSNRDGPLSVPGGTEVISFHNTKDQNNPDAYPDIEFVYLSGSIVSDPILRNNFGIELGLFNELFGPIFGKESFMVFPILLRPKSRGKILLEDDDYRTKPLIYANYFENSDDLTTLVEGVKLLLNITQQPAFQSLGTTLYSKVIPLCENYDFGTDAYWECAARVFTFTLYHQVGTCKMGPEGDKDAVTDPTLKVHGVKGLRIIDASVIPVIPTAHTNAPVFMIAEKGADMIKDTWN